MKKSIIAAALAATVAAPAANANVVFYGTVNVSIDYFTDNDDDQRFWSVKSNDSTIGFKGTEDLGNGLSLIWNAQTYYDFADGDAWGGGFGSYIGLAGDWGTFMYGVLDTPVMMSTAALDLFADTVADYNMSPDAIQDVTAANAIAYVSPNMNGLTVAAAIVPGEDGAAPNGISGTGLADAYSVAAMYSNNGLYLSAGGYEDLGDDHDKWRVGAGYTINAVTLNAVYEDDNDNGKTWQISGAYDFGNNTAKAMYMSEDSGDDKAWAIGLDHALSKRTKAYAVYVNGEDQVSVHGYGDDAAAFSMGMIHNF
ncbi:porin [Solemya velum gill symbiont]|uniref:Porin n=1 Tax=Solemya velum gill symbiont TaxID=2340 RepID=A0A0B0H775_SOVGS|nr:porin [Solemya velum gill symbiont]KHF24507.1 porin [Solemya velum gill symbiont]